MVDLGADVTLAIVATVDRDHHWVAALIGRAMRDAVHAIGPTATSPAGALTSLRRYELALAHGCPWSERLFNRTIDHRTISWDLQLMTRLCALAAGSDGAVLRRLHADGCVWDASTCASAAQRGDLATLQWARARGCRWDDQTPLLAARSGHVHVLEWARDHGCTIGALTFACAAGGGHMRMIEWLRSVGCPWDASACTSAAGAGRLDLLEWMRARGCPWNEEACARAALGGHLETLQWLRAGGCPWTGLVTEYAASAGHLEVLKWARSQGCECGHQLVNRALAHPETVRWLIDNGCGGWQLCADTVGLGPGKRCRASAQTLQDLVDAGRLNFKLNRIV